MSPTPYFLKEAQSVTSLITPQKSSPPTSSILLTSPSKLELPITITGLTKLVEVVTSKATSSTVSRSGSKKAATLRQSGMSISLLKHHCCLVGNVSTLHRMLDLVFMSILCVVVGVLPQTVWASTPVTHPGFNLSQVEYECGLRLFSWATHYHPGHHHSGDSSSDLGEGLTQLLQPTSQLPGWRDAVDVSLDASHVQGGGLQIVIIIQDENAPFEPTLPSSYSTVTPLLNVTPRAVPASNSTTTVPGEYTYNQPVSFIDTLYLDRNPITLLQFELDTQRGTDYFGSMKSSTVKSGVSCRFVASSDISLPTGNSSAIRVNSSVPSLHGTNLSATAAMPVGAALVCDFGAFPQFRPVSDELVSMFIPVVATNSSGAFQPGHVCFGYRQPLLQLVIKSAVVSPFAKVSTALAAIATVLSVASSLVAPEGHIVELQQATILLMNECSSATDRSAVEWAAYFVVSPFGSLGTFKAILLNFLVLGVAVIALHALVVSIVWFATNQSFKSISSTLRFPTASLALWITAMGGSGYHGGVAMADYDLPIAERVGGGIIAVIGVLMYFSIAVVFRTWGRFGLCGSSGGGEEGSSSSAPKLKPHVWEADKIKAKNRTLPQSLSLIVLPRVYYVPRSYYFRWMSTFGGGRFEMMAVGYMTLSFALPLQVGIMSVADNRSVNCAAVFIVTTLEALALTVGLGAFQPGRSTLFTTIPVAMGVLLFLMSAFEVIGNYTVSAALDSLKLVMYIFIAILTIARCVAAMVIYFVEARRFDKAESDKKKRAEAESIAAAEAGAAAAATTGTAAGIISGGFSGHAGDAPSSSPVRALAQFHESASEHTGASVVGEHLNESSAYSQMDSYASAATSSFMLGGSAGSLDPRHPSATRGGRSHINGGTTMGGSHTLHRRRRKVAGGASISCSDGSSRSINSLASSRSTHSRRGGGGGGKGAKRAAAARQDVIIDPNLVQREGGGYGYAYQSQWLEVDADDAFEDEPDADSNEGEDDTEGGVFAEGYENSPVAPAFIGHL